MTDTTTTSTDDTRDTAIANLKKYPVGTNQFSTAPFYRKRWMVVVTALLFIPATLIILATGPVYQGDGEVWDAKKRTIVGVSLTLFMVFTFARLSVQP